MESIEELEEQVTCWVCFEIFTTPITLSCSHSFCLQCCMKVYKKDQLCPFCRRQFILPEIPRPNEEIINKITQLRRLIASPPTELLNHPNRIVQNSLLVNLPDELIIKIVSELDTKSICQTAQACQRLRAMADDGWVWRDKCTKYFPFASPTTKGNWKGCFIRYSKLQTGWNRGRPSDFRMTPFRGHSNYITSFDFYNNMLVSSSADNSIKLWALRSRNNDSNPLLYSLESHTNIVNHVKFNERVIFSASDDGSVMKWDTLTGANLQTLRHINPNNNNNNFQAGVTCVEFDEERVVSGGRDGRLKLWDRRGGGETTFLNAQNNAHNATITAIHIPDQSTNKIVSNAPNDEVKIWDVRIQAAPIFTLPDASCSHLISDSALALSHNNGSVVIYDCNKTGEPIAVLDDGNNNFGRRVTCMSADKFRVATGGSDNQIRVYDIKTRKIQNFADHTAPVHSVMFDDHKLVSGSADNTVKVWQLASGVRQYSLLGGSLLPRPDNRPNPAKPGCIAARFDQGKIVAAFNSLLRVYTFDIHE